MKRLAKIDVSKIDKSKITERTFERQDGTKGVAKEYPIEIFDLKEKKFVTEGKDWKLYKTGFILQGKDNQDEPDVALGDVVEFEREDTPAETTARESTDEIDSEDIPF